MNCRFDAVKFDFSLFDFFLCVCVCSVETDNTVSGVCLCCKRLSVSMKQVGSF
jgi:hypothetical protein